MRLDVSPSSHLLESPEAIALATLFESLPDVCFFVKDHESRFLHVNRALLHRLGLSRLSDIVGTSDRDRYPAHIADQLIAGDQSVMRSGIALVDHAEVLFADSGRLEWFLTTKRPVLVAGKAMGIVGITRPFTGPGSGLPADHPAGRAVDQISRNPTAPWRVATLAREVGISERQLHRQFLDFVNLTPKEFILRTRIQAAAADLRNSREPIASLAHRYRFCDQSAFTRQFRKLIGSTPARYRLQASDSGQS